MEPPTIETQSDAWRLRCPRGHQATPTNNHWYCQQCARIGGDVEPDFEEVVDEKTGETYTRDEIELDFNVPGVYVC